MSSLKTAFQQAYELGKNSNHTLTFDDWWETWGTSEEMIDAIKTHIELYDPSWRISNSKNVFISNQPIVSSGDIRIGDD